MHVGPEEDEYLAANDVLNELLGVGLDQHGVTLE